MTVLLKLLSGLLLLKTVAAQFSGPFCTWPLEANIQSVSSGGALCATSEYTHRPDLGTTVENLSGQLKSYFVDTPLVPQQKTGWLSRRPLGLVQEATALGVRTDGNVTSYTMGGWVYVPGLEEWTSVGLIGNVQNNNAMSAYIEVYAAWVKPITWHVCFSIKTPDGTIQSSLCSLNANDPPLKSFGWQQWAITVNRAVSPAVYSVYLNGQLAASNTVTSTVAVDFAGAFAANQPAFSIGSLNNFVVDNVRATTKLTYVFGQTFFVQSVATDAEIFNYYAAHIDTSAVLSVSVPVPYFFAPLKYNVSDISVNNHAFEFISRTDFYKVVFDGPVGGFASAIYMRWDPSGAATFTNVNAVRWPNLALTASYTKHIWMDLPSGRLWSTNLAQARIPVGFGCNVKSTALNANRNQTAYLFHQHALQRIANYSVCVWHDSGSGTDGDFTTGFRLCSGPILRQGVQVMAPITATYNATTRVMRIYVNGLLHNEAVDNCNAGSKADANGNKCFAGSPLGYTLSENPSEEFPGNPVGYMRNAQVFSQALSQPQIARLILNDLKDSPALDYSMSSGMSSAQSSAMSSAQSSALSSAQSSALSTARSSALSSAQSSAQSTAQSSAQASVVASALSSAHSSAQSTAPSSAQSSAPSSAQSTAPVSARSSAQSSARSSAQSSAQSTAHSSSAMSQSSTATASTTIDSSSTAVSNTTIPVAESSSSATAIPTVAYAAIAIGATLFVAGVAAPLVAASGVLKGALFGFTQVAVASQYSKLKQKRHRKV